jgi:hypothetical protein
LTFKELKRGSLLYAVSHSLFLPFSTTDKACLRSVTVSDEGQPPWCSYCACTIYDQQDLVRIFAGEQDEEGAILYVSLDDGTGKVIVAEASQEVATVSIPPLSSQVLCLSQLTHVEPVLIQYTYIFKEIFEHERVTICWLNFTRTTVRLGYDDWKGVPDGIEPMGKHFVVLSIVRHHDHLKTRSFQFYRWKTAGELNVWNIQTHLYFFVIPWYTRLRAAAENNWHFDINITSIVQIVNKYSTIFINLDRQKLHTYNV